FDITPALASQRIIDTMTDALVVTDDQGIIRLLNPAACILLGAAEEELVGSKFRPGLQLQRDPETQFRLSQGETLRDVETRYRHPSGDTRTLSMSASVLSENDRQLAFIHVLCDITARKEAEERIRFLAYNDGLTKLPNRLFFDERLSATLHEARRCNKNVTVLFLDVDRFKRINDTLGHDAGDELLCAVANRLSVLLEDTGVISLDHSRAMGGILARLGGDEFALALDDVTQIMEIRRAAQSIVDAFAEPFTIGDQDVFVGTSIGIAQFPRDGDDVHQLLKNADVAMYHAKDAGRNCYKFYNDSMTQVTMSRLDLESDLRKALDLGEFEVHYQPQVDIRTGRIFGAEALLRWKNKDRGMISPAEFVPLAEETGLIIPIGQWVLQEACDQARKWHDAGITNFKVAVNLSERQFRQNTLVLAVSQALAKSGLDPAALELELTEGTIMRNAEDTVFTLSELKAMGMHISVDDFGTGYSSLSYLKRFPIDVIKIDRSFVMDICEDADDAAITASIIAMARSLKRDVIAEGVETIAQAHALRDRGCNFMQGYLFSKPVNAATMTNLLETNATDTSDAKVVQLA
ncbi:MAG: EAL domain-containing protein, partial [Gammaproteobacteria bacterium]|nr:EAL domain-containing protein [Gammaproteobacteria bacterium]